jgi:hypothetical protein
MFVLKKIDSYLWPVKIELPKDGGSYHKHTFQALFKRIPQSELKKLIEGEVEKAPTDNEFCKAVMIGWKDIKDEESNDVEYSEENLEKLLEIPMVAKTIVTTYLDSIAGSKVKN